MAFLPFLKSKAHDDESLYIPGLSMDLRSISTALATILDYLYDQSPSIWDVFTADPNHILNGDNGQVACDSYHKYKEDVQLLKNMSVNAYRFSIAWTRIIPD